MNATSKEKNLTSRRRAQSQSLRTTADIACIGVHPSAVEALQQYKKALKIYETNSARGGSVGNNNSARHNPSSPLSPKISSPSPFYRASSPTNNQIAEENKQLQQHESASPALPDPYYSISAVKNRLLLDIAADYVCETAFRQLFVDHKKYALFVEGEVNDHEPNMSEASDSSSPLHPPPCRPFVKGPKMIKRKNGTEAKEPVTVNLENPAADLVIDDMLWVVDNRKAPSAHVRALTAWQDNYESNITTAPLGPPACTDSAAEQDDNNSNENTSASGQAQSPPKGSSSSAAPQKGNKGAQTLAYYANVIPAKYPLSPSTVCVSKAQQIQLHRRNVMITREYFATAAAAESEYRVAVQDLGIAPHPSHALLSPSNNSFVPIGSVSPTTSFASPARNAPAGGGGALSPASPAMPAYTIHSPPQAVQLSYPPAAANSKESTAGKEKGFGKFIKALSKVMDGEKDKEKEEGDVKNSKGSSGGGEDANNKEKVSDVLAASASSLAATIGRLTGGKFSTGSAGGFSDNPRANRVGSGHLISELVGLPPISWRETLAANIITQWTYTLTIAVAKLVTSTVNASPATPVSSSVVPVSAPTITKKELVVMRHISKRVYAQPTKAMFHTKEHRGESGDTMDYPNVYFNIDDFEDEDLFKDIKLSEGFTFAVLLTAGATHNSNATIFRGALSYDVVMERIKREEMRSEGKNLPITPAHPSFSNNGSFGHSGGGGGGGNNSSRSLESKAGANSKDKYSSGQGNDSQQASKLFIPLVGPERKGKAELAVSISETEIMLSHMSSQNTSFCGDPSQQSFGRVEEERRSSASRMNSALFKDGEVGGDTTNNGEKGSSDKEKDTGGGGIFGRLINKVKSKVESGGNSGGNNVTKDSGDGYLSPSRSLLDERTAHGTIKSGGGYKSKLNGGEAIQCCLTFVSVHAQHVLDVLLSNDLEKNQQWLSYYESDELTKALSGNLNS